MTVATDTFVDFVDHLTEALDDHEATGEELAARLHFSRFHFDRIDQLGALGEAASARFAGGSSSSGRRTG